LVNPAADLKYFTRGIQRKAKKRDLDIIPIDQGVKIIEACVSNPRFQRRGAMVVTALATGMRFGELVALQRSDLEPAQHRIFVQRTWSDGSHRIDALKDNDKRYVPFPLPLRGLLREHTKRIDAEAEANGWGQTNLVFLNKAGRMDTSAGAFYDHCWTPLAETLQLPRRKFHST